MKVSIIIPVYFNEGTITTTFRKVSDVFQNRSDLTYEVVIVDDGSQDGSYKEILALKNEYKEIIKVIKFSRNFGQVSAIYAGYAKATGDCSVVISADLQDPPELIEQMVDAFIQGNEIVMCIRNNREEGFFRKATSKFFYRLMQKMSFANMPLGGFDFVLIGNKVKRVLLQNSEKNPFWQGQILWSGFKIFKIEYTRKKREIGESKWTMSKKVKYFIDGLLAYSYAPLRFMSILGIILFFLGILYAFIIVIRYFLGDYPFQGWAPIMILILVLSGIQMLMLGIIGEYLWRALDQIRNRPLYIIEEES